MFHAGAGHAVLARSAGRFHPAVSSVLVLLIASAVDAQFTLVSGPPQLVAQSPKFIVAADFNGDQFEDVAVNSSASNKVTVLFGGGDLTFKSILDFPIGRVLRGIHARDLNDDDTPDLATLDFLDGRVFYVFNSGTGTFGQPASLRVGGRPVDMGLGRFDPSGRIGIFVVQDDGVWIVGEEPQNCAYRGLCWFRVAGPLKRGVAADLNGDGFDDIIVVGTGSVDADEAYILMNNGTGSFRTPALSFAVGAGAKDLAVADVDGDGALDLLVLNATATAAANEFSVSVLINRTASIDGRIVGTGVFDPLTPVRVRCPLTLGGIAIQCVPNFLTAGDYDQDTFVDFALSIFTHPRLDSTVQTPGLVVAFAGRGDGAFDFSTQVVVGLNPQGVVSSDFDGDGIEDIAVAEQGSKSVRILTASHLPPQACTGDCDGDGDVAVDELVAGVDIALGTEPMIRCLSLDVSGDGAVTIDELVRAVKRALSGCTA